MDLDLDLDLLRRRQTLGASKQPTAEVNVSDDDDDYVAAIIELPQPASEWPNKEQLKRVQLAQCRWQLARSNIGRRIGWRQLAFEVSSLLWRDGNLISRERASFRWRSPD